MARKYTILKVLIQNLNKAKYLDRGFTLIELIVGLLILSIVSGLALNAFVNASKDFSQDKKTIDSSQNLSAILEIIGNDIKQAGEQISDSNFPAIEISQIDANSSIITLRRALTTPLTLCEPISIADPARSAIVVADTTRTETNCNVLPASPLVSTEPAPNGFVEARNYRCKLGDPNANYTASTDYCATALVSSASNATFQNVRGAISDGNGRMRAFTYTGEDTSVATQTKLVVNAPALPPLNRNNVAYAVGSPVYLIEERQYTLVTTGADAGNLQLSVDGGTPTTLIRGVDKFKVSAKAYTNATDRIILPSPPAAIACTAADGVPTAAGTATDPIYGCRLNDDNTTAINWKWTAGVRVELQAKYDGTGRAATASTADTEKLQAAAEFFPRNVLSK
jgi:prepilin-type N-terminal cleavage/methylation domain-containing protein